MCLPFFGVEDKVCLLFFMFVVYLSIVIVVLFILVYLSEHFILDYAYCSSFFIAGFIVFPILRNCGWIRHRIDCRAISGVE